MLKLKFFNNIPVYLMVFGLILIIWSLFVGFGLLVKLGGHPLKPRETNIQLIQTWMTIPHISKVYGVPESVFFEGLNIDRENFNRRSNIDDISRILGQDTQTTLNTIRTIIITYQSENQKRPDIP